MPRSFPLNSSVTAKLLLFFGLLLIAAPMLPQCSHKKVQILMPIPSVFLASGSIRSRTEVFMAVEVKEASTFIPMPNSIPTAPPRAGSNGRLLARTISL